MDLSSVLPSGSWRAAQSPRGDQGVMFAPAHRPTTIPPCEAFAHLPTSRSALARTNSGWPPRPADAKSRAKSGQKEKWKGRLQKDPVVGSQRYAPNQNKRRRKGRREKGISMARYATTGNCVKNRLRQAAPFCLFSAADKPQTPSGWPPIKNAGSPRFWAGDPFLCEAETQRDLEPDFLVDGKAHGS